MSDLTYPFGVVTVKQRLTPGLGCTVVASGRQVPGYPPMRVPKMAVQPEIAPREIEESEPVILLRDKHRRDLFEKCNTAALSQEPEPITMW